MLTGRRGNVDVDYWTPENKNAKYPKPGGIQSGDNQKYGSTLGLFDGGYCKLRNLSLGYNLPKAVCKNIGISNLKVYVQGRNLGNIYSSVDFLDLDLGSTYYNRGCTVGLQVGF